MDKDGKDDAFTLATKRLALQKGELENQLLASQVRKNNQTFQKISAPTLDKKGHLIDGQPATQLVTPDGAAVKVDDIKQQPDTASKFARIRPFGMKLYTNPYWSDAEDVETRYGDVVQNIQGVGNFFADAYSTGVPYWNRARNWYRDKYYPTFQQRFTGRR